MASISNGHIVFVINTLESGGAGKILRFVAETAAKHYGKVSIIALFDKDRGSNLDDNINCISLGFIPKNRLWRVNALLVLRRTVKELKPSIVCVFLSDVAVMMKIAMLGMKTPFISAERGDPNDLEGSIWKPLVIWAYQNSDRCIFQLEGARDYFNKHIRKKSFVIPNPYLEGDIKPWYGSRKKTIVSAGRFEHQKGFDVLIDAYAEVHKEYEDYSLILYGDGSLKSEIITQIKELGIEDNVTLPGYVTNIAERIKMDGIFVLPSRFEGIPNVLIEALCVGIPTISTDCPPGGPAFLTDNGERGMLVEVDNAKGLKDAIIHLIQSESLRQQYSVNGPKVVQKLDKKIIADKWIEALNI